MKLERKLKLYMPTPRGWPSINMTLFVLCYFSRLSDSLFNLPTIQDKSSWDQSHSGFSLSGNTYNKSTKNTPSSFPTQSNVVYGEAQHCLGGKGEFVTRRFISMKLIILLLEMERIESKCLNNFVQDCSNTIASSLRFFPCRLFHLRQLRSPPLPSVVGQPLWYLI